VAARESDCSRGENPVSAILESIRSLSEQNPGAFGQLVVELLCKLAEMDHDAYEYLMSGVVSRELHAAGMRVALAQAKQALSLGNTNRAEERLGAIEAWLHTVEYLGSRERLDILLTGEQKIPPNYVM
jgi:hypothetical protein